MRYVAKPFFDPGSEALRFLPEGPRRLRHFPGELGWVAIEGARCLNVLDLRTRENRSFPLPGRPGFFAETTQPGLLLVGLERRLVYFDLLTGETRETGVVATDDERVIINDGLAVEGGVLFGTKHLEFNLPIAALYFWDYQTIRTVIDGQLCSNGKFLSRGMLIDIDSTPKTITRYRFDDVRERSLVADPANLPGFPDGLRPAPDGLSVIVAFFNPGDVADGVAWNMRISDGAVLDEWIIPGAPRVTCPEFVEIDGEVKLLFTTAVEGMPAETRRIAPGSGCIYIADTPFASMPALPPLVPVRLPVLQ